VKRGFRKMPGSPLNEKFSHDDSIEKRGKGLGSIMQKYSLNAPGLLGHRMFGKGLTLKNRPQLLIV